MISRPAKPDRTAADALAAAVIPILIMLMVGSFIFFLLDLAYGGPYRGRLRWTMAWFVLAMVLISRISVRDSFGKASLYGVVLAWATAMWIFRFVDFVFGVLAFLAFIWWCASKLVWDCSMLEEEEDASGEGLIAVAGFAVPREGEAKVKTALLPWWRRLLTHQSERAGMAHAPGLCVVYFSLFAVPVFGLGASVLPEAAQRQTSFAYFWVFILSALSLLLISSFLGLRRYLRQRYLSMPGALAWQWFKSGAVVMALVLLGALALPRPERIYQISGLVHSIGSSKAEATENAWMRSEPRLEKTAEQGAPAEPGGEQGRAEGGSPEQGESSAGSSQPSSAAAPSQGTSLLRLILAVFLALAVVILVLWHWRVIFDFLRSLFGDLQIAIRPEKKLAVPTLLRASRRKFASFRNPFSSGRAAGMEAGQLLVETFDALEAWGSEQGLTRGARTPLEFAERLSERYFNLQTPLRETALAYSRLAYGNFPPEREIRDHLERLWEAMSTRLAAAPGS